MQNVYSCVIFREEAIKKKCRLGISPILVHRLNYENHIIARDLLRPVCKDEAGDEAQPYSFCV